MLFRISRPRFWIYVFGPYIVGALAGAPNLGALLDWRVWVWGLFFLFPANLLIYGVNDIFDYETDRRNAKKTGYENLLLPAQYRKIGRAIAFFCLPFAPFLGFVPPNCWAALAAFLFFSIGYSAPPIRAKARPIWDSVFNVLYVCPGVFAFFLAGGQNFSWLLLLGAWAWAMAMHAYSAVPDISADKASDLSTVATFLGLHGTLGFCLGLYLFSALVGFFALGWLALALGALYALLMIFSLRANSEGGVMRLYRFFPLINTLAGMTIYLWILARKNWF